MNKNKNIKSTELKSERTRLFLAERPHWLIRWGTTLIACVLLLILLLLTLYIDGKKG